MLSSSTLPPICLRARRLWLEVPHSPLFKTLLRACSPLLPLLHSLTKAQRRLQCHHSSGAQQILAISPGLQTSLITLDLARVERSKPLLPRSFWVRLAPPRGTSSRQPPVSRCLRVVGARAQKKLLARLVIGWESVPRQVTSQFQGSVSLQTPAAILIPPFLGTGIHFWPT